MVEESAVVFLEPNCVKTMPFTTSDVIARYAEVKHEAITRLIRNRVSDLETFGKVGFEIRALTESKTGQSEKI